MIIELKFIQFKDLLYRKSKLKVITGSKLDKVTLGNRPKSLK